MENKDLAFELEIAEAVAVAEAGEVLIGWERYCHLHPRWQIWTIWQIICQ